MNKKNEKDLFGEPGHELANKAEDPFMCFLHKIIRGAVKVLAVLMVTVIVWGIGDVIYVLYQRFMEPPFLLLSIGDILATFGAFLAVLIAVEIFINITLYLKTNVIPVRLVVATALMAISRKVIKAYTSLCYWHGSGCLGFRDNVLAYQQKDLTSIFRYL